MAARELLSLLSVAAVDHALIEQALTLPYADFEDAVQMVAAIQAGAQHLVTRDLGDYRAGPLPAGSPAELLALVSQPFYLLQSQAVVWALGDSNP